MTESGSTSDSAGDPVKPSGLRNPARAVRGVAAAALAVQALVLLLALAPLWRVGGSNRVAAIWVCVGLAVLSGVLAGLVRHRWAWSVAALVPVALLVGGYVLHWSLALLGVLFGLVWAYVLTVRRSVLDETAS
jgi:hypothetical protein